MPTGDAVDAAFARIDSARGELIQLAQDLVRVPSVNPPGDERAAADFLAQRLSELGLGAGVEIVEPEPKRATLIRRAPAAPMLGRTLTLCGHLDTAMIGDTSAWPFEPLAGDVVDGRLRGRGTTDMKGAVAAMVYAAWAVESVWDGPGDVMLLFLADEEHGGLLGGEILSTTGRFLGDAMIIGEPSGTKKPFEYIGASSRGILRFEVVASGTQMHSSLSELPGTVNANMSLAHALVALEHQLPPQVRAASPADEQFPGGPTVNLGLWMGGGFRAGIIPGVASAYCEIRTLPGGSRQALEDVITRVVAQVGEQLGAELRVEFDRTLMINGTALPSTHPLVAAASRAAEQVLGRPVPVGGFPGGTDARFFVDNMGVPTIAALGPGLLPIAHSCGETVGVDEIVSATKLYAAAALFYFADGQPSAS